MNIFKVKESLLTIKKKIISIVNSYEIVTLFQTAFEVTGVSLGRKTEECSGPMLKSITNCLGKLNT